VVTTSKAARLREIFPMTWRVFDPPENLVSSKIDSRLRIWFLNWIKKDKVTYDHTERWNVESVVADRMERSLCTTQIMLIISYSSKQYWNWTNYTCWDSCLHHRPHVLLALNQALDQILLTFKSILRCRVTSLARPSGRGSGGSMTSGITSTVHNPVTQIKRVINLSVMN
jgi:hypothetical protein